jgi:hypothetical protein
MIQKFWLSLHVVASVIATFGWLCFLAWLAWEVFGPMFA